MARLSRVVSSMNRFAPLFERLSALSFEDAEEVEGPIRFRPPASPEDLARLERRLGGPLVPELREFLSLTMGITGGGDMVLGLPDFALEDSGEDGQPLRVYCPSYAALTLELAEGACRLWFRDDDSLQWVLVARSLFEYMERLVPLAEREASGTEEDVPVVYDPAFEIGHQSPAELLAEAWDDATRTLLEGLPADAWVFDFRGSQTPIGPALTIDEEVDFEQHFHHGELVVLLREQEEEEEEEEEEDDEDLEDSEEDGDYLGAMQKYGVAREPTAVVRRFSQLVLVSDIAMGVYGRQGGAVAEGLLKHHTALSRLRGLGLEEDLEADEVALLKGIAADAPDPNALVRAVWRWEAAGLLAWALGWVESLPPLDQEFENEALYPLVPATAEEFSRACARARLRPLPELVEAMGEAMNRFFLLEVQPPSEMRSRAIERTRALRWLFEEEELSEIHLSKHGW